MESFKKIYLTKFKICDIIIYSKLKEMIIILDDILLQEIQSLKEKLKVAIEIVKYYEPDLDENLFYHNIGTEDYLLYLENNEKEKTEIDNKIIRI